MQDVIQSPEAAFLLLLAGAISLPARALRRYAIFPLAALALAIAGLRADPIPPVSLTHEGLAGLPVDFLGVTAGLFLLGIFGAASVAVLAGRRGVALLPGPVCAAWSARGILTAAGAGPSLLGAATVAALVAVGLGLARQLRVRERIARLDLRSLGAPAGLPGLAPAGLLAMLLGSTLLARVGAHLALVLAGAAGASWSLWWLSGRAGRRWPVLPLILTLLLAAIYLFMNTVAGPEGLSMSGLAGLPISPAADVLLGAAFLAVSWLMSGLWPLHRWTVASLLAPAGMLALARAGLATAPAGVEHWRALAAPLGMLALWHAGAIRWTPGLAVGGAWLALVSGAPVGVAAARWLAPAAVVLELLGAEREDEAVAGRWMRMLALAAVGWGGMLALEAGLRGEVVYTVLAAGGAALGSAGGGQAITPSAPRTPAPSA